MRKTVLGVFVAVGLCAGCASMRDGVPQEAVVRTDIPSGSGWMIDAVSYTFDADGSCTAQSGEWKKKGTWSVENDKFVARWEHGYTDTFDLPGKDGVFTGINQRGRKAMLLKKATKTE